MATSTLLEIQKLKVEVEGKEILKGVDLKIEEGQTCVLFGPNGSGKTSLLLTIVGYPRYKVTSGRIIFKGRDLTELSVNDRIKMGLGVTFQLPPAIRGVKLREILKVLRKDSPPEKIEELSEGMNMKEFLGRDINLQFSGGEIKRSEILQILVQEPDLAMFDEPDSGVDLENIELVGVTINTLLKNRSGLVITHHGYILKYIQAQMAYVLYEGKIACCGEPQLILDQIKEKGYSGCKECPKFKK